jgi:hypothetical protein
VDYGPTGIQWSRGCGGGGIGSAVQYAAHMPTTRMRLNQSLAADQTCRRTITYAMSLPKLITTALIASLTWIHASAATPINKCVINGSVTFQSDPCPSNEARKAPTVDQLNAEQKKRAEAAASAPARQTNQGAIGTTTRQGAYPDPGPQVVPSVNTRPQSNGTFRCDGRTYCSQMTSCAESKFFLANCPGVKMDGDSDGIPCEEQWCGK